MLQQQWPRIFRQIRVGYNFCQNHYYSSEINSVPLTTDRYPNVKRGDFAILQESDVKFFESIIGANRILTQEDELNGYNTDWLNTVRGQSKIVLKPKTTEEVAELVGHCVRRKLAICPQGGNTGLVGGSVPVFDEVIISTNLMDKIEDIDVHSGVVQTQAGVVLEKLDTQLGEHGLMAPLDLGAKGSCHIGGNVATNAGGLRLLRYGSLHANVLGLEVVLPTLDVSKGTAQVLDCMTPGMKKDNTGYDLKQLFIGAEGTLGIITRLAIACPPKPKSINLAYIGLESFDQVLLTFQKAKEYLGEILSSCEFMDGEAVDCVTTNLGLSSPIERQPFYMMIETSGSNGSHDEEKLSHLLEHLLENGTIVDGTMATSPSHQQQMWPLRERIAEALLRDGYCYKYDISLPFNAFYQSVDVMKARLGDDIVRCVGYGHIGDGNMHLNITSRQYNQEVMDKIEPYLYQWTSEQKGSISAEHGMGFKKRNYMHFSKCPAAIQSMHQIKQVFDPHMIMNPYKVLPGHSA